MGFDMKKYEGKNKMTFCEDIVTSYLPNWKEIPKVDIIKNSLDYALQSTCFGLALQYLGLTDKEADEYLADRGGLMGFKIDEKGEGNPVSFRQVMEQLPN